MVSSRWLKNNIVKNNFQGENSIDFAERVKHEIAKKGGLVELLWDGNLKRNKVKKQLNIFFLYILLKFLCHYEFKSMIVNFVLFLKYLYLDKTRFYTRKLHKGNDIWGGSIDFSTTHFHLRSSGHQQSKSKLFTLQNLF